MMLRWKRLGPLCWGLYLRNGVRVGSVEPTPDNTEWAAMQKTTLGYWGTVGTHTSPKAARVHLLRAVFADILHDATKRLGVA